MTSGSDLLVLRVGPLLRRPGEQRDEVLEASLDELVVLDSRVPAESPIIFKAHLESLNESIVVTGELTTTWEGICRRCLKPLTGTLRPTVQEIFVRSPVEGETWPIDGDRIDLEPIVREAVLLELPMAPLCSPDCAGLCPECGADCNISPCQCSSHKIDPRWAALEDLRLDAGNE